MSHNNNTITDVIRKPRKCPHCGGKVVRILYGEPTQESYEQSLQGKFVLGGCCINEESPDWECTSCHHQFRTTVFIDR